MYVPVTGFIDYCYIKTQLWLINAMCNFLTGFDLLIVSFHKLYLGGDQIDFHRNC